MNGIQNNAMKRTTARRNLQTAIRRMGGLSQVGRLLGIRRQAVFQWVELGSLNHVRADRALNFARAAKEPLDQFIVDE